MQAYIIKSYEVKPGNIVTRFGGDAPNFGIVRKVHNSYSTPDFDSPDVDIEVVLPDGKTAIWPIVGDIDDVIVVVSSLDATNIDDDPAIFRYELTDEAYAEVMAAAKQTYNF